MISPFTLDPVGLTLWCDPSLIGRSIGTDTCLTLFNVAASGDLKKVLECVEALPPEAQHRAINIVSCVWHEKRHFIDYVLTNFGAFNCRQFFQLLVNLTPLLLESQTEGGPLFLPLESVADPVSRLVHGLPQTPQIDVIADYLRRVKEMLSSDFEIPHPNIGYSIGGTAAFEALGFTFQLGCAMRAFGLDAFGAICGDLGAAHYQNLKYRWAEVFLDRFGLLRHGSTNGKAYVDLRNLTPILYTALMCRFYDASEKQTGAEYQAVGLPSERLVRLLVELGNRKQEMPESIEDIWCYVSHVAAELWGRTPIQELDADLSKEERLFEKLSTSSNTMPQVRSFMEQFHSLRLKFRDILMEQPNLILDTGDFAEKLLPELSPMRIIAYPQSKDELAPGEEPIFRYSDGKGDRYLAVSPSKAGGKLGMQHDSDMRFVVSDLVPLAKLLMNGRRHNIVLGVELEYAERLLEMARIKFKVDPLFAYPTALIENATAFEYLTKQQESICDLCSESFLTRTGSVISPWLFRANECARRLRHTESLDVLFEFSTTIDWSCSVVCTGCATKITQCLSHSPA
ncbi:MAG: hypothetical protein JWQ49_10 [Edaphobacter sp.]|nr:hypothetical protein [Edaphobacter sp.]